MRRRAILLAAAALALSPAAAAANVPAVPVNWTGTWSTVYHCQVGWCAGQNFPNVVHDTQVRGSNVVTSVDSSGSHSTAIADGRTLTNQQPPNSGGGYTAQVVVTMGDDGLSLSGTLADSNNTSGTVTGTRPTLPDPGVATGTQVGCALGAKAGAPVTCEVFVGNIGAASSATAATRDEAGEPPVGAVDLVTTDAGASFPGGTACTLAAAAGDLAGTSSCSFAYTPGPDGASPHVTATYPGTDVFGASAGTTTPTTSISMFGLPADTELDGTACLDGDPDAPPPPATAATTATTATTATAPTTSGALDAALHPSLNHEWDVVSAGKPLDMGRGASYCMANLGYLAADGTLRAGQVVSVAGGVFASVVGALGFIADPEPISKAGAGVVAVAGIPAGVAGAYVIQKTGVQATEKAWNDPPNPAFRTVLKPAARRRLVVRAGLGVSRTLAARMNAYLAAQSDAIRYARVLAPTIDRAGGAAKAGATHFVGVQTRAIRADALLLSQAYAHLATASARLAPALVAARRIGGVRTDRPLPGSTALKARALFRHGVSAVMRRQLTLLGFSRADIAAYVRDLHATVAPATGVSSLGAVFADPSVLLVYRAQSKLFGYYRQVGEITAAAALK